MPTEQQILDALRPVQDPELGISVVDLGMIREIDIDRDAVEVKMVLTTPHCPLGDVITQEVQQAAAGVEGVSQADATLLDEPWDPKWTKQ